MLLLLLASAVVSAPALYVFGRASNPAAIRRARSRVNAALLEMRLFGDEPAVALRAFARLWWANALWLKSVAIPSLAAGAFFLLVYFPMDALFGTAPLPTGGVTLVTAQLQRPADPAVLQLPIGFAQDAPPVRDARNAQVFWRVRALQPVAGDLQVTTPSGALTKAISAEPGAAFRFPLRAGWPTASGVRWIEVRYPSGASEIPGHWLAWFSAVLALSAGAWRRRFHLTF